MKWMRWGRFFDSWWIYFSIFKEQLDFVFRFRMLVTRENCSNSPFAWNNPLHQTKCDTIIRWIRVTKSLLKPSLARPLPSLYHQGPNNQFYQSRSSRSTLRLSLSDLPGGHFTRHPLSRHQRIDTGCWRWNNMNKKFPFSWITLKPF